MQILPLSPPLSLCPLGPAEWETLLSFPDTLQFGGIRRLRQQPERLFTELVGWRGGEECNPDLLCGPE